MPRLDTPLKHLDLMFIGCVAADARQFTNGIIAFEQTGKHQFGECHLYIVRQLRERAVHNPDHLIYAQFVRPITQYWLHE
ncbi:hypothetical protein D9M70_429160 [compost metagenome]